MITTSLPSAYKKVLSDPVTVEQNLGLAAGNRQKTYAKDDFWTKVDVDPAKFDTYCPYQLLVLEAGTHSTGTTSYKPYLD